ncbi:hypothetical protein [Glaciecola sp. 1036]|uniref:hypothetical protein n=1 Tax=Alteromonadaceae TaxID=72275 RepID=UPI003D018639
MIGFALIVISFGVAFFTDTIEIANFLMVGIASVLTILINTTIVYGLVNQKMWAIRLGLAETAFFLILSIMQTWTQGLSFAILVTFLLLVTLVYSLLQDYRVFKTNKN